MRHERHRRDRRRHVRRRDRWRRNPRRVYGAPSYFAPKTAAFLQAMDHFLRGVFCLLTGCTGAELRELGASDLSGDLTKEMRTRIESEVHAELESVPGGWRSIDERQLGRSEVVREIANPRPQ